VKELYADFLHTKKKMEEGVERGLVLRNELANDNYSTDFIAKLYSEEGKGFLTARVNILGHMQQGGRPTPFDRNMGTKMAAKAADWLIEAIEKNKTSTNSVYTNSPETVVLLGLVKRQYKFSPIEELMRETNYEHRIPKEQWWLKLRPLLRILAKHQSTCTEEDYENTGAGGF